MLREGVTDEEEVEIAGRPERRHLLIVDVFSPRVLRRLRDRGVQEAGHT